MKIDKKNPLHWLTLVVTGLNTITVVVFRAISSSRNKKSIILYGHKFNGNLRSFYNFMAEYHDDFDVHYLTMDHSYKKSLKGKVRVLITLSLKDMLLVARSSVIMTSHGSHSLVFLNKFSDVKFIDVWHGISYKGWGPNSFGEQKNYDGVWVSSPAMKAVYEKKYLFNPEIVKVTGYSRIDQLVNNEVDPKLVLKKYNIPKAKKYILIAVTWRQDSEGRSIVPFNMVEAEFFLALERLGKKHEALIIFRTHLNSSGISLNIGQKSLSHVSFMPYHEYEITEDFLVLADILVTDWSSIAFDYLPLKRPTIFLDVESPFLEGYAIDPKYRFGPIVGNIRQFIDALSLYLKNPEDYLKNYKKVITDSKAIAYGNTVDGKSSERYFSQLKDLMKQD